MTATSRKRLNRLDLGAPLEFTAAVAEAKGAYFVLRQIRTEPLQPHEVLVKVVATGVSRPTCTAVTRTCLCPYQRYLATRALESSQLSARP
jgi:hypothetical protein